jgi:ABC-type Fe3+ transport system permease subunit
MIQTLKRSLVYVMAIFACVAVFGTVRVSAAAASSDPCSSGSFFGLPSWHKYLPGNNYTNPDTGVSSCTPKIDGLNDVWKIVAAVIEILLRLSSLIAIGFIVYGGVLYLISQGSPDKTKQALQTIISALVGLVISIVAAALVGFIASRFSNSSTALLRQPLAQHVRKVV